MNILIVANEFFNLFNFRRKLIEKISIEYPYANIHLLAKFDGYEINFLKLNLNIKIYNLNIHSRSENISNNIFTLMNLFQQIWKLSPNLIIAYTVKPIFFCSILKFFFKYKLLSIVTGLGEVYLNRKLFLYFRLYRYFILSSNAIICQNQNDINLLNKNNYSNSAKFFHIRGSGVDRSVFKFNKISLNKKINIFFIGRIIKEKGVIELLKAIIKFNRIYPNKFNFTLIGDIYQKNINFNYEFYYYLKRSKASYFKKTDNVVSYINKSTFIILPSYREGLSRILLESLSVGRPIITSNVPGCAELVKDNYNGFIIKNMTSESMFNIFIKIFHLTLNQINILAKNSYINSNLYSHQNIDYQYISIIKNIYP